jgi:Na+-transporting NADH:ubiquinone oxidoreductase subunit NqrB
MATPDDAQATVIDWAGYAVTIVAVYVIQVFLWYYSAEGKLFHGNFGEAPQGIVEQFDGTIVDLFPGADAAWAILGILEFVVFLVFAASILTGEFLPNRRKTLLQAGLCLALFDFSLLLFGQTSTSQNESTASIYTYFGVTVLFLVLVRRLPPHGPENWLSGVGSRWGGIANSL